MGDASRDDCHEKAEVEKEKEEAETAKSQAEKDLEAALADAKEKGVELHCLRDREAGLLVDLEFAKKKLTEEKARADQAEASLALAKQVRQDLVKIAEDSVKATEDNLKEQILLLAPDFDVSLIGAWKEKMARSWIRSFQKVRPWTRLLRISLFFPLCIYYDLVRIRRAVFTRVGSSSFDSNNCFC
ncbi:hypothetical protein PIB30_007371 [Stylosanthes scabra]|uniref:Uncharacterized protein n=1 Tax=Stylosanthes scabra TaxID=79078 RepID=A0ABU6Z575_9FABA|nr:hypothetical protein [Stylosanthes scabra]